MRFSWKLGRIAGINVFLHPTLLLLLLIPQVTAGGWESLLVTASVFGCVLLHELGHALAARRFGIGTEDITLYPIGGVARLQRMPTSPSAEMAIALAGPAVNFAIAFGLIGLSLFAGASDLGLLLPFEFLGALVYANLLLGCFNLIPAFPMDGGRVLRASLSNWLGRARATMVAAGVGRFLAVLFGVYSLVNGMWPQVFLAMFVYMVAGAETTQVLAQERRRNPADAGIWTAPPGYHWVSRGNGVWQLAPIVVTNYHDRTRSAWR
jgi:Zn-dependent protease